MSARLALGFIGVSVLAMGAAVAQQPGAGTSVWPAGPDLALSTGLMTELAQLPDQSGGGDGGAVGPNGQVPSSPAAGEADGTEVDRLGLNIPDPGPMHLMPDGGREVQADVNARIIADDDNVFARGFLRAPIMQRDFDYLMLQGEGTVSLDTDAGDDFYILSAGLIYRRALTQATAMGLNAFVEAGETQNVDFGQVTLGWEAETVWPEGEGEASSLMVGGNFYLPFEDYTGSGLHQAPRVGADLFTSAGWQWDDSRIDTVLSGYYYADTMDAQSYYGAAGDVEYRYFPDWMPQGSHLFALAGVNYDTLDEQAELRGRVGLSVGLDGLGQDDGGDRYDRVADVRRNLATGSALVPIEPVVSWSAMGGGPVDLGCGVGLPPAGFMTSINVDGDQDPGPTLESLIGLPPIEAACTQGDLTYQDCVDQLAGYTGGWNSGQDLFYVNSINQCTWTVQPSGGGG